MPAELPARHQAVAGAQVVDFRWAQAGTAISAINHTVSTLTTQLDQRANMLTTLPDWSGTFRREFNAACADVTGTATGVKERLQTLASSIVSGADEANRTQRIYNGEALRRQAAEQAQQEQEQPAGS